MKPWAQTQVLPHTPQNNCYYGYLHKCTYLAATVEWYQCDTSICLSTLPCPQGCITWITLGVWWTIVLQHYFLSYFFHLGLQQRQLSHLVGLWMDSVMNIKSLPFVGKSAVTFAMFKRCSLLLRNNYYLPIWPAKINMKLQQNFLHHVLWAIWWQLQYEKEMVSLCLLGVSCLT